MTCFYELDKMGKASESVLQESFRGQKKTSVRMGYWATCSTVWARKLEGA